MEEKRVDSEILVLAIAREVEAYHFYMAAAERVDNPQMRQILEDLAKEELEHKAKLELEILKSGQTLAIDTQSLEASRHDYAMSNIDLPLDIDYKEILLWAIEKEEESFRIYIDLISAVHDQQSRETLLAIAEEEVKHKHRFEIEYNLNFGKRKR